MKLQAKTPTLTALPNICSKILPHVSIEGHTDKEGDAKFNRELSEKRAGAVKEYLLKKGAKSEQITTFGFGEEKPLSEIAEENRRVEVHFEK
jgi:outer membrane protein OmpA-like peptidoglycan-associated protein